MTTIQQLPEDPYKLDNRSDTQKIKDLHKKINEIIEVVNKLSSEIEKIKKQKK